MSNLERFLFEPTLNTLKTMLAEGELSINAQLDIYLAVKKAAIELQENQVAQIQEKIYKWESVIEGTDSTLYTLGLRHAIDIITGNNPTEYNGFDGEKYQANGSE